MAALKTDNQAHRMKARFLGLHIPRPTEIRRSQKRGFRRFDGNETLPSVDYLQCRDSVTLNDRQLTAAYLSLGDPVTWQGVGLEGRDRAKNIHCAAWRLDGKRLSATHQHRYSENREKGSGP